MPTSRNEGTMPYNHLHELFVDELRDILGAERQLLKALKTMSDAAMSEDLKRAFDDHRMQTEGQIDRLKKAFESLGLSARGKKCKAMEGLIEEANEIMEDFVGDAALDAALISAAQKVEHYEIASYGCLVTYAKLMEHDEAERLLAETLEEEKQTDINLTELALNGINAGTTA